MNNILDTIEARNQLVSREIRGANGRNRKKLEIITHAIEEKRVSISR